MKFHTTSYHFDLLKDKERLSVFYEGIKEYLTYNNSKNLVKFDIGCGCGVLSFFHSTFFKTTIAIEKDKKAYNCAKQNLKDFKNIKLINEDVLKYNFNIKADLIVCEMLDTGLIDEGQVTALKHVKKFLKEDGIIIPFGVINIAELVYMEREYLHYDDGNLNNDYSIVSNSVIYSQVDFSDDDINPVFQCDIQFKIKNNNINKVNGIKLTTITKITNNIICGPTPMLNPPILFPLNKTNIKTNNLIKVRLKYIMGKGIETIDGKIIR